MHTMAAHIDCDRLAHQCACCQKPAVCVKRELGQPVIICLCCKWLRASRQIAWKTPSPRITCLCLQLMPQAAQCPDSCAVPCLLWALGQSTAAMQHMLAAHLPPSFLPAAHHPTSFLSEAHLPTSSLPAALDSNRLEGPQGGRGASLGLQFLLTGGLTYLGGRSVTCNAACRTIIAYHSSCCKRICLCYLSPLCRREYWANQPVRQVRLVLSAWMHPSTDVRGRASFYVFNTSLLRFVMRPFVCAHAPILLPYSHACTVLS